MALLTRRRLHPAHERTMEADLVAVLRQGVGPHRLGSGHAAHHRDGAAHVCRVVSRAADLNARLGADDGIPRWGDLAVRTDAGAVSDPRAADDVPVCVGGTLSA